MLSNNAQDVNQTAACTSGAFLQNECHFADIRKEEMESLGR